MLTISKTSKSYKEIVKAAFNANYYNGFIADALNIIEQNKTGNNFPEVEILYIRLKELKEGY
jgi:hypothetical protein